jgi:hypothetical protein
MASNQVVGGSNPSGRTKLIARFNRHLSVPADHRRDDSNRRLTTSRFDKSTEGRLGRGRAQRDGGPERSGGRAAQPRAIRPGAPIRKGSKSAIVLGRAQF